MRALILRGLLARVGTAGYGNGYWARGQGDMDASAASKGLKIEAEGDPVQDRSTGLQSSSALCVV